MTCYNVRVVRKVVLLFGRRLLRGVEVFFFKGVGSITLRLLIGRLPTFNGVFVALFVLVP